ncbi:hypothetical protein KY289_001642 [Solanum tuberosum]|nr:hypothetical protein KY289_001642 [Solanum tuberosum]
MPVANASSRMSNWAATNIGCRCSKPPATAAPTKQRSGGENTTDQKPMNNSELYWRKLQAIRFPLLFNEWYKKQQQQEASNILDQQNSGQRTPAKSRLG